MQGQGERQLPTSSEAVDKVRKATACALFSASKESRLKAIQKIKLGIKLQKTTKEFKYEKDPEEQVRLFNLISDTTKELGELIDD